MLWSPLALKILRTRICLVKLSKLDFNNNNKPLIFKVAFQPLSVNHIRKKHSHLPEDRRVIRYLFPGAERRTHMSLP